MKKCRVLFYILLLSSFLVIAVNADGTNSLIYQYENPEVTIVFSEPLNVSAERQQEIADKIAGIPSYTLIDPNTASPENIICTIFGHNMSPTVTVTATHHKVNQYQPRCLMEIYHVNYCTRCDYTIESLENSFFIACCPED